MKNTTEHAHLQSTVGVESLPIVQSEGRKTPIEGKKWTKAEWKATYGTTCGCSEKV